MNPRHRRHLLASSSIVVMAVVGVGLAAPGSALAADAEGAASIEEVVVTAQKREQKISDIGMSITAQTGDQLKARGVSSIEDFTKIDTSFTAASSFTGTPSYTIRGIGYYSYALAAPPAVSVYLDEVPFTYSPMTKGADMDLERVEILKGPQGTLFGQNSTGGAINFIAAKPTSSFEAGVEGTYARFGAVNLNGFVSGPITDTLQARLALDTDQGGAWQKSYTRSDSLGDKRFVRGRLTVAWTPTDRLIVHLGVNGWRDHSDTQAGQLNGVPFLNQIAGMVPQFVDYPPAPHNDRAADWDAGKSLRARDDFYQTSVRVDYDLAEAVKFTSISAYSGYRAGSEYGFDGVDFENFYQVSDGASHTFSQEGRLSGKAFESRLDWVVGANYSKDVTSDFVRTYLTDGTPTFSFVGFGAPRWQAIDNRTRTDVRTWAVFTNLDYKLTDTLSVNAGARYTDTRTKFSGCTYDTGDGLWATGINDLQFFFKNVLHLSSAPFAPVPPGGCTTFDETLTPAIFRTTLSEDNLSWHAGLDWKPTPDILIYGSVTKGYKAGAFPIATNLEHKQFSPVTQEAVQAYEAGFKTYWFDRSLLVEGAYFHYDYTDKQIQGTRPSLVFGTLFGLINVPKSTVDGVELSGQWRVPAVDGLTLHGAMTYLDSEITSDFVNVDRLMGSENLKGEAFPNTPKWAYNVGLYYERPVTSKLNGYFAADYSHRSGTHGGLGNLEIERIKGYGLLDLRAGVRTSDDKYYAEVFGRNITNTYYWLNADYLNDAGYRLTGMPATYGIRLGYRFR